MIILRYLLFPFAILYGWITSIRNFLYDKEILKSHAFDVPVIAVGNLSVGGTGKTPQIEYLIRLLSSNYKIATLSRGYKRKSKGFSIADVNSNSEQLGDEPYQMHLKFPEVTVAVDANRKNGIEQLLNQKPDIILLDDAFQHRKVKAGFYILLTAYDDLFCDDFMLPTGNLRESSAGAQRANIIIVTKCPKDISVIAQENIKRKLGGTVPVFFSYIDYDAMVYNGSSSKSVDEIRIVDKLLLAGIAKPEPFFRYLYSENDEKLVYPDHHHFTENDIKEINNKQKNLIITTEKDYVRLKTNHLNMPLFYLPIKSSFISDRSNFDTIILNYVGTSTRNR